MSAILGNGSVTFGDSTVQTTASLSRTEQQRKGPKRIRGICKAGTRNRTKNNDAINI